MRTKKGYQIFNCGTGNCSDTVIFRNRFGCRFRYQPLNFVLVCACDVRMFVFRGKHVA